ncbi:MAG: UDP-N-acetylglucosamine 2-epimerase [Pirellulales bacterium]
MKRHIAVFTSSRGDLGPLGPVLIALDADARVELMVIATGTHLTAAFGGRVGDIRLPNGSRLEVLDAELNGTQPVDLGQTYGKIAAGVSGILGAHAVDILVLLGDRWELLAAAGAALIHGVPIAHLHGGESTEGAIDERVRHGITKLADLHLCATENSARRIRHLGEEPWRIVVTGAPGLDRLNAVQPLTESRIQALLGKPLVRPLGVVVYHPPTVDRSAIHSRAHAVFEACARTLGTALILYPGADPGAEEVIEEIHLAIRRHPHLSAHRNLGEDYLALLKTADVLVGNSSSGIIEAASLALPVIDVGDRQQGREQPRNVMHVEESEAAVAEGIRAALDDTFRSRLAGLVNPYGDGAASARIVAALLEAPLRRLKRKPLVETPARDVSLEAMGIPPSATLRDAMAAIDRGGSQIAFVIESDGRLVGSLSDGDLRRALLGGAGLEGPIDAYITRVPVVATPEDDARRVLQLMERNGVTQIPVVDDRGRLVGLHLMNVIVSKALDRSIVRLVPETGIES